MSKLKEADYYYGAVLSTLLNHDICPALIEGGKDRQIYDFTTDHKDFRLFLKYRSIPNVEGQDYTSWQFVFSDEDIAKLTEYMKMDLELSIGLVCGRKALPESEYAVLHKDDIQKIFFDEGKKSLTIGRKKGEHAFRISVGGGRDNAHKIKANTLY